MLDVSKDIHSLTAFKRNTAEFARRIKETGGPLVLTVNGEAELVVVSAEEYQRLAELADRAEAIEGIRRGLDSMKRGEGIPLEEADQAIRRRNGIPG